MALANLTDDQIIAQLDSGLKWSGDTITYSFPTEQSGIYGDLGETAEFVPLNPTQQAAAELALRLWDDLIAPDMQRVTDQSKSNSANVEFGFSSTSVDFAHSYYPFIGSVWFDSGRAGGANSLTAPVIGTHGFDTYIHEIGHAIGLEHMGDYNGSGAKPQSYQDSTLYSVMSYFGPSRGTGASKGEGLVAWADWVGANGVRYAPQTPMLNDIMAIQQIYGVETTTRTGNTVYGFNSNITDATSAIYDFSKNLNPILTIFDSSGVDTLDLSGWSTASTIDLAPGAFSSGNAMTLNIAIARNSDIENAVGGAGADTISGNALANRLTGGAGNDTLSGLAGDDILTGGAGDDILDGGAGTDWAYYAGSLSTAGIAFEGDECVLSMPGEGTDRLTGIEWVSFAGETYSVSALTATRPDWRLFAADGFVGEIGGNGNVVGTAGLEDIKVADLEGTVTFDSSFNRGGDIIRLSGNASNWSVAGSGSSAIFTDGDTEVSIPVGTIGTAVAFDDGVRMLRFDAAQSGFAIGWQTFSTSEVRITAAPSEAPVPNAADPSAAGRLFVAAYGEVTVGGTFSIFGTSGHETIVLNNGDVQLDPSFNKGGDLLIVQEDASAFTAALEGSTVRLESGDLNVLIPVGSTV